MKRTLIVFVLFLSACSAGPKTVPLFIYDGNDAYISEFEIKIHQAVGEDFLIKTYESQNSQIIQNEQIDQVFKDKHTLLIINPVDRLSVYAIIEKARQNDTTLIFFNREPLESDLYSYDKAYYVGADATQSAELQASVIMDLFDNDPKNLNQLDKNQDGIIQTVILKGEQGHQDAEARTKFVIQELNQAGYKIQVLDIVIANWDREIAYSLMDGLLEKNGEAMELLISNNDAMALGAIERLSEKGFFKDSNQNGIIDRVNEPWFPVVGIDGISTAIESIKAGYLYGTVKNDSQNMALIIIELTKWLLEKRSLEDFPYEIKSGKYVWVNYQKMTLDE
ncbi:MAG: methyl-galactoside transport system substrate-binding protein [Erysipelotrichaceae bacterium]|nr:MAG: methyl-galactoside transport system substrate-binding [Erysipelotrichaceae bacterium]TXT17992.1 MAG: methyl-galactoside transport system substrate-binding protein [Erysipelotrichaceae bacterium]